MLDFRKVLALTVASLGLVGIASAQVATFAPPTAQPFESYVANEGLTELLPALQFTIANGTSLSGTLSITLTSSVPFTNMIVKGAPDVTVTDTPNGANDKWVVTQPGPTTTVLTLSPVPNNLTSISVAGLRVNASAVPSGTQVSIAVSSSQLAPTGNASVNMAFVAPTVTTGGVTIQGSPNVAICSGFSTKANIPVATATITGGFQDAFKSPAEINPANAVQGTTLAVTFTNLNPGISYYVPSVPAPTTNVALIAQTPIGTNAPIVTVNGTQGLVLVPASGTVYYMVTGDTAALGTESFSVSLVEAPPPTSLATFTGPVGVSVSVASASSALPPTSYPEYISAPPVFSATATGVTVASVGPPVVIGGVPTLGQITACGTTLLFPYVVNMSSINYDTGIAITNASGLTTVGSSAGTCQVNYYGPGAPTTQPAAITVAANSTATFDVGAQAPGINGYAVANCNFEGAHGLAFISYQLGTNLAISNTYLAVVTTSAGGTPTVTAF